jgi:hypothetical membrane protein
MNFWGSNLSWLILIMTLLMYFIFAHILSLFYPNYSNTKDVISLLGNPDSPVASIFRVWFILVGLLICVSAINFYIVYNSISHTLASIGAILLFIFGISSGIIAGIFSLDKEKRLKTKASIIHSISVGFGFTCLGFTPIIISLICFKNKDNVIAITSLFCFTLSLIFSTLFILSEKKFFKKTIVGFNGLWQRLFLATLYFPLLLIAVNFIMISSYGK